MAIGADIASRNPARDVPYLKGNLEGIHTWTLEEVERYQSRHPVGTMAHLALAPLAFTGVRRCDVVRLRPQMERDGRLCFTEVKGRDRLVKHRALPILPELRIAIAGAPSGLPGDDVRQAVYAGWFWQLVSRSLR